MTWYMRSVHPDRLINARSVATEAFRTADFVMAVQMVMCDSDRSILVYHHVYGPCACDGTLTLVTRVDGREVSSRPREAEVRLGTLRASVSGFENAMQI